MIKKGKIYIIGFGPGDPELMTIKTDSLLKQCEIIIFDDLIDKEVLNRYNAEKIYVGKRKGIHSIKQKDINTLLCKCAIEGKIVARLKGGDPLIFGRVGEEIDCLNKNNIDFEIIPGVTSAFAAAAFYKIPFTKRGISSSVAFCTGHPENKISVPDADTLVYYMGASNYQVILQKVIAHGWNPKTPVAFIQNVSLPNQKIKITTLITALNETKEYASPLIIIIGKVVKGINPKPRPA